MSKSRLRKKKEIIGLRPASISLAQVNAFAKILAC
jgi:hypothetical protein